MITVPVLINWKICDNAKECNGVAICPSGAITWDEKKKSIKIDNSKCTNCGKCEPSCPVGAIRFAKDKKEYVKIEKEINDDSRKRSDLFIDRYGASPIHPAFQMERNKFNLEILQSKEVTALELWNKNSIKCLLHCIPIKDLSDKKFKYRKLEIDMNDSLIKEYGVKILPTLLFFKNGKVIGKIESVYKVDKKDELKKLIDNILKKN